MEGFPVTKISQQTIAPAVEKAWSAAAYAKSIEYHGHFNNIVCYLAFEERFSVIPQRSEIMMNNLEKKNIGVLHRNLLIFQIRLPEEGEIIRRRDNQKKWIISIHQSLQSQNESSDIMLATSIQDVQLDNETTNESLLVT
ncbi:hypothetical protein POM88_029687 [Heracleum sosnowskyi]|uniref:Uncharacterized protein n=1 Tax=Heracleum sosnowskyi TaxID=360622 RepID=A0AAD8HU46_9APIA|nr:hypothetical protein POM88_029687 [Heracleum sosnowskyi]